MNHIQITVGEFKKPLINKDKKCFALYPHSTFSLTQNQTQTHLLHKTLTILSKTSTPHLSLNNSMLTSSKPTLLSQLSLSLSSPSSPLSLLIFLMPNASSNTSISLRLSSNTLISPRLFSGIPVGRPSQKGSPPLMQTCFSVS